MIVDVHEYGAVVSKKSNCLVIHVSAGTREISADQITEIHIWPSCNISSDALQLCMAKNIWVLFLDQYGQPQGEVLPFSGGCSPIYKRNQLILMKDPAGVELVKEFLSAKIGNRISQLKKILRNKSNGDTVLFLNTRIKRMEAELEKIKQLKACNIDEAREILQGYEGGAGRAYFESISYLLPEYMKFSQRMRNAHDIYNCVLNYLYGILYAKIKKLTYQCRLDPYIGIMHVDSYNKPTFVYDFIESQRIIGEEIAYQICVKQLIKPEDMFEDEQGRYTFSEKARKLIISKFYDKMKEEVFFKKKKVTRERRMYLELLEVAKRIGEMNHDVLAAV